MKLTDFSRRFGQKILFDHLSFTFDQDGVYYLYGDNGISRTTLFHCIAGIDSYSGTIEKTGSCLYVFGSTPFYLNLTGLDNLILLTKNRQVKELIPKQKIDFLLLSFLPCVKVKNYSLGEKKILSLLLLLLLTPRVVLLDGMLNRLDQKNREVLLCCLVQLKERATVILSGHKEYYLKMADELPNVKNGKIEPITSENLRSFFISTKRR